MEIEIPCGIKIIVVSRHLKKHIKQEEYIMRIWALLWISFLHSLIIWN